MRRSREIGGDRGRSRAAYSEVFHAHKADRHVEETPTAKHRALRQEQKTEQQTTVSKPLVGRGEVWAVRRSLSCPVTWRPAYGDASSGPESISARRLVAWPTATMVTER